METFLGKNNYTGKAKQRKIKNKIKKMSEENQRKTWEISRERQRS